MSDTSHIDRMRFQAACYESNAREAEYDVALELKRPFILLGARVFPDGDQWCALYGMSIQEGVCGFGDTPAEAAIAFDLAWLNQKLKAQGPCNQCDGSGWYTDTDPVTGAPVQAQCRRCFETQGK